MSIHPDIKKAIEIIDQRIESLHNIRENLAKEFGMYELVKAAPPKQSDSSQLVLSAVVEKKSKDKIAEYLRAHAPASRAEILSGTGLPKGTISYALNDKDRFRLTDGGWTNATSGVVVTHSSDDNKTDAVRQFFKDRSSAGATPKELQRYLAQARISERANYAYSAIARLKKRDEIKRHGKRYFATEKLLPASPSEMVN